MEFGAFTQDFTLELDEEAAKPSIDLEFDTTKQTKSMSSRRSVLISTPSSHNMVVGNIEEEEEGCDEDDTEEEKEEEEESNGVNLEESEDSDDGLNKSNGFCCGSRQNEADDVCILS